MKEILIAVSLSFLLVLMPVTGNATEVVIFDGHWWQKQKKLTKVIFVAGVMQGYLSGHYAGARDYALNLIKKHPSDTEALFKKGINLRDVFPDSPKFSKPFGYYVDQINSFYIAHQSYSDITVSFLMGDVLADGSEYTFDSWIDYLEELGVIKERR